MRRKKPDITDVLFHDEPSALKSTHDKWEFRNTISTSCTFAPQTFLDVMMNLVQNPNITAAHLFRADILYDSINDVSYVGNDPSSAFDPRNASSLSSVISHMKPHLRPRAVDFEGFRLTRSIVRELVPRNPRVDKHLIQSCHFYDARKGMSDLEHTVGSDGQNDENVDKLVLYLPHVDDPQDMPWYHPCVKALAFWYTGRPCSESEHFNLSDEGTENKYSSPDQTCFKGEISIHSVPFTAHSPLDKGSSLDESSNNPRCDQNRLHRTLLRLLATIKKHGIGQKEGYEKRGRHDSVISQKRFQDTYTRLKMTYAQTLMDDWREQTDPRKHVFEDLGIAAFLIELWNDMYGDREEFPTKSTKYQSLAHNGTANSSHVEESAKRKGSFPGFVDVACGNGVLVHVLISEGYAGWGFDARQRKSWQMFPSNTREHLKEMLFVPYVFLAALPRKAPSMVSESHTLNDISTSQECEKIHNGIFPSRTFIISNHADELTVWTPIMSLLSGGNPFLCIPCCSHDFAGRRTRFPKPPKEGPRPEVASRESAMIENSSQLLKTGDSHTLGHTGLAGSNRPSEISDLSIPRPSLAAETGSLSSLHDSLPGPFIQSGSTEPHEGNDGATSGLKGSPNNQNSMPRSKPSNMSAYATLCAYVKRISRELDYNPIDDMLRIPSTRNVAIVCKENSTECGQNVPEKVQALLARELQNGLTVDEASKLWMDRARKIQKQSNDGGH